MCNPLFYKNKKQYTRIILVHFVAIAFSMFFDTSFGFTLRPAYALAIYFLLMILANTKKTFSFIVVALILTSASYAPVSFLYGSPNINIILSISSSNVAESLEFIKAIPLKFYFHSICVIATGIFVLYHRPHLRVKNRIFLIIIALCIVVFRPIASVARGKQLDLDFTPVKFINKIYSSIVLANKENQELAILMNTKSSLSPTKASDKFDTYILVIGESVRRDFMGSYGFPINNTPFMNSANGIIFRNYISSSCSTQTSLTTSLTLNGEPQNNLLRLAKKQGLETWWISNQGSHGNDDSRVSKLGKQADRSIFLKKGEYNAINYDDRELLPYIKDALQNSQKNKLIVIHLMGSHPDFCTRTAGSYQQFYVNKSLSCYVQSIKNTDSLLHDITIEANKENKKWTMIYFSDHGLSFINPTDKARSTLIHGDKTKQNYSVPLFITSYDDTGRSERNEPYSAMDFLSLYLFWTGSHEEHIKSSCNPLVSDDCKNDNIKVKNFDHNLVPYSSLVDEPFQ